MILLLSLLFACQVSDPGQDASSRAGEPPPTDLQPEEVPTLFREVVEARDAATGLRLRADGLADLGVGDRTKMRWWSIARLDPITLAAVRMELASDELAALPDQLPDVPSGRPSGARATYVVGSGAETRTIVAPSHGATRVPVIERVESLVRGDARPPPVVTRWHVELVTGAVDFDVPCDPSTDPDLRPILRTLLDKAARPEGRLDDTTPVLARIVWGSGNRVWTTTLHESGLVVRTTERGEVLGFRLTEPAREAVRQHLAAIDPKAIDCGR